MLVNSLFLISVAQATPGRSWRTGVRSFRPDGNSTENSIVYNSNGQNVTTSNYTWSGNHSAIEYYTSVKNPTITNISWSYGSGNINRPLSRTTCFIIKY